MKRVLFFQMITAMILNFLHLDQRRRDELIYNAYCATFGVDVKKKVL